MNTLIEYMYRDADNYKVHNSCVCPGEITSDEIDQIIACLDEGEFFIPSVVGMPTERFSEWDDQSDHDWLELTNLRRAFSLTDAKPTLDINIHELAGAFLKAKDRWEYLYQNGICVVGK